MDVNTVKSHIKSGKFDNYYIWLVEEAATARFYIDKIAEVGEYKKSYADSLSEVYSKASQKSLLSSSNMYVIIDDKEFLKNEKAWSALGRLKDDLVIFYYTTADRRLKFWKNFKDRAVEFGKLNNAVLKKHIKKEVNLSDNDVELLIEVCEGDYSRILLEIDKIKRFGGDSSKAFKHLLKEGVIYQAPKDAIFDFVNAVLDRQVKLSYTLLEQSYAVGEANMVLLSVLYTNFRNLLQVQTCDSDDIAKSTGLSWWEIKNVKSYIDRYTDRELISAVRLLQELDMGVKTGRFPDEYSVHYFMIKTL